MVQSRPRIEHFNYVYCKWISFFLNIGVHHYLAVRFLLGYLFYEFDKFWFSEKPSSVMEFNIYMDRFSRRVRASLKNKNSVLRLTFSNDYTNKMSSVQI